MKKESEIATIKGSGEGIIVTVNSNDIDNIKEELRYKIDQSLSFFKGAKIKEINSICEESLKKEILTFLKEEYSMDEFAGKKKLKAVEKINIISKEEETKYIYKTVRSGQLVRHKGNIIVIGDVNPGGIVEATGNIIIFGSLKGVAKAGKSGNESSIIAAIKFEASQVKIANLISRRPDEEFEKVDYPEVAKVKNGSIVIESYNSRI